MAVSEPEDKDLKSYIIPLKMHKESKWEDKHKPDLIVNIKYVPYAALRQQLWRCLLNHYGIDDSGRLTRVELVSMLDSLDSTLSEQTINGFFQRFQQSDQSQEEEITVDQAVICLEDHLLRQSKGPHRNDFAPSGSMASGSTALSNVDLPEKDATSTNPLDLVLSTPDSESSGGGNGNGSADSDDERVIRITECPLCHQPRLNKRSEVDIVTHLATCASRDWRKVDHFVMAGFVTSDQAHRKWYTKVNTFPPPLIRQVISKITYGGYKLGANSANILVQDRLTGQIQEERMSVYVRLGIRLLYKGLKSSTMEKQRSAHLPRRG